MKKNLFAAIFAVIFFAYSACSSAYTPEGKLRVSMLDIGQGDAFLIETPEQNILLDTGDVPQRKKLVRQLKNAGITRIERIILTHPHNDHIGGASYVVENFPVDEIIDNGIISTSPLYIAYHSADVKFSAVKAGDVIDFGGGVKFKVFNPDRETVRAVNSGSQRSRPNNESIIGKLTFGEFSVIFTGDADKAAEDKVVDNFQPQLQATILKASHHGSKTSSSDNFVASVAPSYVFISAGKANSFGHPHKQSLATFRENFILPQNIFCTRFNGSVVVETDGKNHVIAVENENNWVEEYTKQIISVIRLD
ncbi:MAG: MBL fold metallo-hydrolase [Selenomonadaceae bacterium]|nr:MBL fold metallo-hydrolase [Selenomonadaceae bacterium]